MTKLINKVNDNLNVITDEQMEILVQETLSTDGYIVLNKKVIKISAKTGSNIDELYSTISEMYKFFINNNKILINKFISFYDKQVSQLHIPMLKLMLQLMEES